MYPLQPSNAVLHGSSLRHDTPLGDCRLIEAIPENEIQRRFGFEGTGIEGIGIAYWGYSHGSSST
jgi:hypothetical protein